MLDITAWSLAVIAVSLVVGAMVQSVVGIGLGLVAAPIIALAAPQLMPGSLLLLGLALPLATLAQTRTDIDWHGFTWTLPGRVVGTVLGVWVVATVSARDLGVAVALVVLAAVALTARAVVVPINRTSLSTAGFASGLVGTTSAIGGPPMALLYQHRPAQQIRSTLAVFFVVGVSMSLVGLAVTGQLTITQVGVAGIMLPTIAMGIWLSTLLQRGLPASTIRPLVLVVSASSAIVLLVRSL